MGHVHLVFDDDGKAYVRVPVEETLLARLLMVHEATGAPVEFIARGALVAFLDDVEKAAVLTDYALSQSRNARRHISDHSDEGGKDDAGEQRGRHSERRARRGRR